MTNVLIFFYTLILIVYGAIHTKLPSHLLLSMNIVTSLFELLIILNSDYQTVALISMNSLAVFFLFVGVITKMLKAYKMNLAFFIWFCCGFLTLIFLYLYAYDDFHKEKLGFMKFNIFLGLYSFGIWSVVYFADYMNMD